MIDALFGTEIEYGIAGARNPVQTAEYIRSAVFKERRFGLVDPAPRDWDEEPGNGGFLFNGARVYLDSGHLEYATAECRTLDDIVEQENAGNAILLDTVEAQELNRRVFFVKNNTDYLGNTFGYHENYSVRLNPRGRDAVFGMMPFLVTRQLFAGAGMVDLAAGRDGRLPYHMSQRAAFVTVDVSRRVRFGGRPIINLRDEPLAEAKGLRRLHVIVGDANCSEYATALKVGTTALVAQLLERGWDPDMYLEEPVAALKGISRSPGGPWTVALVDRGTVGALEIQRRYLDAAQQAYAGRDADTDWTLGAWTECLDALADDPDRLIGKVDWLTKLARLRDFVADAPKGWADPDLVKVDLAYHHIDPAVSLYAELQRRGKLERRVHTPPNALATPVGTRAIGRARVVRALAAAHADAAIDWDAITKNLGSVANWENQLYLVYQYIDDWKELTALGGWNVIPYLIDWAGIGVRGQVIEMPDPFQTYASQAEDFAGQVARYLGR